jgi:hypothetical protein
MILDAFALLALALAALPAVLTAVNLVAYRAPRSFREIEAEDPLPRVAVMIPARDEAPRIAGAVEAALKSRGVEVEVVVMDDHSSDETAAIVRALAEADPRVRLEQAPPVPRGWAGKSNACQALADRTTAPWMIFVDADVELAPDGAARAVDFLRQSEAGLVSGFPRQITGTLAERLLIPLMYLVLLGYLPLPAMRRSASPAFAAGCGQLMVARRQAYEKSGGYSAARATFADGLALPRAFRRAGSRTDLFDATTIASCRMYEGAREVFRGLAKNAHEGMASPVGIWVWSILLLGGHVLPFALIGLGAFTGASSGWLVTSLVAGALALGTRLAVALRFSQSLVGAFLHPFGVLLLVAIQWYAWWLQRAGRQVAWKGRMQEAG